MNKSILTRKTEFILNLTGAAILIYTIVLLVGMTAASLSEVSVPNEYQEVTSIQLTDSFLHGVNPYRPDQAFEKNEPGLLYAYGPVYSLVSALVFLILPVNLIFAHYLVSFLSMLGAASLGALLIKRETATLMPPAGAFLLILNCTWRYGYINAVPDALAFFLTILILFVETKKECRHRELIEVLLTIAAFYTKIYMAFIILPLLVYKLLTDKKAAKRLFLYGFVLTSLISVLITLLCPLLWTYSVYFVHGPWGISDAEYASVVNRISYLETDSSGLSEVADVLFFRNVTDPENGFGYEVLQLRSLIGIFLFFFLTAIIGFVETIRKKPQTLIGFRFFMLTDLLISIPVMIVLGTNGGAWLSYYLQIQIPPLIIFSLIFLEEKCLSESAFLSRAAWILFSLITLTFTVFRTDRRLSFYYMTPEQKEIWDETYELLDTCLAKGEIYYSPILGFHAVNNRQYFYNNGYIGAIWERFYAEYLLRKWQQTLFPDAGNVMKKHLDYRDELEQKIRNGDYVLVTVIEGADGTDRAVEISEVEKGPYRLIKETDMPVSREDFILKFYLREDLAENGL